MKEEITLRIKGQDVTFNRSEFWELNKQVHEIARKADIMGYVDCVKDDYGMSDKQVEEAAEWMFSLVDDDIEGDAFDHSCEYWLGEYVSQNGLENKG